MGARQLDQNSLTEVTGVNQQRAARSIRLDVFSMLLCNTGVTISCDLLVADQFPHCMH